METCLSAGGARWVEYDVCVYFDVDGPDRLCEQKCVTVSDFLNVFNIFLLTAQGV